VTRRADQKFKRNPRDYYRTWDTRAVAPLLRFLPPRTVYVEPCAGRGDLVDQLKRAGHVCHAAIDIDPQRNDIRRGDMFDIRWRPRRGMFITNPPWKRETLHALIRHLAPQAPTWLLFDADWLHNDDALPFMPILQRVVSVGRLRWIEGSDSDGHDNHAWYLFDGQRAGPDVFFHGREAV
jgi:hypothetical protein